jgi:hypothetical protein
MSNENKINNEKRFNHENYEYELDLDSVKIKEEENDGKIMRHVFSVNLERECKVFEKRYKYM